MFSSIENFANLTLRSTLADVRGRFFFVRFVKRDGSIREMRCQLGNDAAYIVHTEQGDKASATFHANNPDMVRVRDIDVMRELSEDQKHLSWRTIDCAVIMSIRVDKITTDVRRYDEALNNVQSRVAAKTKPRAKKVA